MIFTAIIGVIMSMLGPVVAHAQSDINKILSNTRDTFQLIIWLLMTLAVAVFAWGIVKLIAASGDPNAIREAKGIITYGIIGIFILSSIAGIVYFIQVYFGIPGGGNIKPWQF